ncbi:MAG TPA: phosphatase PAP2 family protein, partial [Polyangiaceae bacterium]
PAAQPADAQAAATPAAAAPSTPPAAPGPPSLAPGQHFVVDPVLDGVVIVGGAGFSALLGLVLSSGEITANPPASTSNLLSWDRGAVTQTIDPNASTYSDIGLYTAVGFAVLDPILSAFRNGWDAGLVDAMLYAETVSLTEVFTDVTKIAVRRPRPIDYLNCSNKPPNTPGCTGTDLELSFFSGHASTVASIGATATYLAFVRDPGTARPWITLGASAALTSFVSYERVRSGNHFPTDVIVGSMAGAAIGIIVPHLHRHKEEAPHVWVGAAPATQGTGGTFTLGGVF